MLLFSIDHLCEVMRHAIELGEKILYELRLENSELVVNEVGTHSVKKQYVTLRWFNDVRVITILLL